jgi:hypothetical protein
MKKRNQKNLKLNKSAISKLQLQKMEANDLKNVVGGLKASSFILICEHDVL